MYPVPQQVFEVIRKNPYITPPELSRKYGVAGRTARRYINRFKGDGIRPEHGTQVIKRSDYESALDFDCSIDSPYSLMRAAVWDLEVTDFGTDKGVLLMCCILPLDSGDVQTIELQWEDGMDDRRLWGEIREALSHYAILIGHNTASFDENWFNSRGMPRGYQPLHTHLRFDTYQIAQSLGIATRKSLGNLMAVFGIDAEKTTIYAKDWYRVYSRDRREFEAAMGDIRYHCQQDVIGNRELFCKLAPYAMSMGGANPFKMSKYRQVAFG